MSPTTPLRRTWLEYMPVKPTSATAPIRTFRESRTTTSVVAMDPTSKWGWSTWTPMNRAHAGTGERSSGDGHGGAPGRRPRGVLGGVTNAVTMHHHTM